jgi:NAD+ synthase
MSEYLKIDERRTLENIEGYVQHLYEKNAANGVLIGLSGGVDSSVLSALAVNALGAGSVHMAYLYDQHSDRMLRRSARMVSEWLGLELEERSIEPAMREMGVYSPFGMRATSFAGLLNRLVHEAYRLIFRESPFVSSLRLGSAEASKGGLAHLGFRSMIRQPEAGMNARHRYRRRILEDNARNRNWLLMGAANRTEWLVGWFVKDGIDDLPFQPIMGLYKTQVRQIAAFLEVPAEVLVQAPSPDMMRGITDEFALGLSYSKIDIILDHLEGGLTKDTVLSTGCSEGEIQLVREMNRLSHWKRVSAQTHYAADGGPEGGLRL